MNQEKNVYYTGKYVDTFEAAMGMLFGQMGYSEIKYLNAVGKRCFGFRNGAGRGEYYLSLVGIEEAVDAIARHAGLKDRIKVWRTGDMDSVSIAEHTAQGIVCGPVNEALAVRQLKNIYYRGENHYLFIKKESEDRYVIADPEGFSALLYTKEDIMGVFQQEKNGVIIGLRENDGGCQETPDLKEIWDEGCIFHREISCRQPDSTECAEAFAGYENITSLRTALWYGVMNFLQQTERLWELKREAGILQEYHDEHLRILQSDMTEAAENGEVTRLAEIESAIWKEIIDEV